MVLILAHLSYAIPPSPKVEVIHFRKSYAPGKDYPIAFRITVPKGLLLHGHEVGPCKRVIPRKLAFEVKKDVFIEDLQFPRPQQVNLAYSDEAVEVYRGEVVVRTPWLSP